MYLKFITNILAVLINHEEMLKFYTSHNVTTLTEVHKSFINQNKITIQIQKKRVLSFPEGTDILSVIYLYETKHKNYSS